MWICCEQSSGLSWFFVGYRVTAHKYEPVNDVGRKDPIRSKFVFEHSEMPGLHQRYPEPVKTVNPPIEVHPSQQTLSKLRYAAGPVKRVTERDYFFAFLATRSLGSISRELVRVAVATSLAFREQKKRKPGRIPTPSTRVRLFADDCMVYREIKSHEDTTLLQNDLNRINDWAIANKMKINSLKSKAISFTRKRYKIVTSYTLGGETIPEVNKCKYLGITFSSDLGWGKHVTDIAGKAWRALHFVMRVLRKGSDKSKEIAYKSLVRPVMEYGAACWDPYRLEHIKTLEKIQKRALKCCRKNSPLKWDTLTDRRTRIRLCALFKTYRGEPAWREIKNRLQPPNYSSRNDHSYKLRERRQRTGTGKFSFLNRTIRDWNALPADLLKALPTTKNVFLAGNERIELVVVVVVVMVMVMVVVVVMVMVMVMVELGDRRRIQQEEGLSSREVASCLGLNQSDVVRTWNRFRNPGIVDDISRSGRPRATTECDDRYLRIIVTRNPENTAGMINNDFQTATGRCVSNQTVRNRLHDSRLHSRRPWRSPTLTPRHHGQRYT
ncbi:hypothetical protein ANN_00913 [Periplaneta americana]|uniref:Transposase Tc1-like domain-containing protein n=1 Tax=Periplaneta americana TaxID=6978 RepID=A0ABQ8TT79_PERAM|nr:hypothetical protein ANN_00913 [Periplaneta americana]